MLAAGCLLFMTGAAAEKAASKPAVPKLPLTTTRQAHSLTAAEAAKGYPVHVRGVVVYCDPYDDARKPGTGARGGIFVADRTGTILVTTRAEPQPPIHAGSMVDVTAITNPGGYAPVLNEAHIVLLPGSGPLPKAVPQTIRQMLSGRDDGRWVSVEGIVRAVSLERQYAVLTLDTDQGTLSATAYEDSARLESLVDARVRIEGIAAPLVGANRTMVGVRILFPGPRSVKVEERGPADPFSLPIQPLNTLLQYSHGGPSEHRIHVRGTVTLAWPGQTVCITDAGLGICMQTVNRIGLRVGQAVDVVGFLGLENFRPTLTDATVRLLGEGTATAPISIQADKALNNNNDGKLVRVEGVLVGTNRSQGKLTLVLAAPKSLFTAILPAGDPQSDQKLALKWIAGSKVALTGVFAGVVDQYEIQRRRGQSRLQSFQILLPSPGDVAVIAAPSWWNGQHALTVLGSVVILTLGILIWVQVLRHQVRRQTETILRDQQKFRYMAQHDALTGLYARTVLIERLEAEVQKATQNAGSLALFMIDVDGFKHLNDSMGHAAGDEVLIALSRRLERAIRESDTVARLGGDEFAVLLPGALQMQEIEAAASRLLRAVASPFAILDGEVSVSISIGIATFPSGGRDSASLMRCADAALYRVKAMGRKGFQVFCGDPSPAVSLKSMTQVA